MPLTYRDRGSSGTQLDIVAGSLVIGTLWKVGHGVSAARAADWRWTFHLTAGPPGFRHDGSAGSIEAAKSKIAEDWTAWLRAAELEERGSAKPG